MLRGELPSISLVTAIWIYCLTVQMEHIYPIWEYKKIVIFLYDKPPVPAWGGVRGHRRLSISGLLYWIGFPRFLGELLYNSVLPRHLYSLVTMASSVPSTCTDSTHYQVFGDLFSIKSKEKVKGPVSAILSESISHHLIVSQQRILTSPEYHGDLFLAIGNLLDEWNQKSTTFCRIDSFAVGDAIHLNIDTTPRRPEDDDSWDTFISICPDCVDLLKLTEDKVWRRELRHHIEEVTFNSFTKTYYFTHHERCINCYAQLTTYKHCTQCMRCLQDVLHPKLTISPLY